MNNYIPTQQELEEMGFAKSIWWDMQKETKDLKITINAMWEYFSWIIGFKNHMGHIHTKENFFPSSRQDIEAIIRLFTSDSD